MSALYCLSRVRDWHYYSMLQSLFKLSWIVLIAVEVLSLKLETSSSCFCLT